MKYNAALLFVILGLLVVIVAFVIGYRLAVKKAQPEEPTTTRTAPPVTETPTPSGATTATTAG